jgi:hypothetical protein
MIFTWQHLNQFFVHCWKPAQPSLVSELFALGGSVAHAGVLRAGTLQTHTTWNSPPSIIFTQKAGYMHNKPGYESYTFRTAIAPIEGR